VSLIDVGDRPNVEFLKQITSGKPLDPGKMDAYAQLYLIKARESFEYYRCLLRPGMITSWWTEEIARAMQQFYDDLIAGKRPMLAIGSPPQHGKSWAATDLIAWVAGKNPDLKAIYASYSDELGTRTNVDLQRMMQSPQYKHLAACFMDSLATRPPSATAPDTSLGFSIRQFVTVGRSS
jgi:hypothetical protein